MIESMTELMNKGMKCLTEQMGIIEAEQFISIIIRENLIIQNGSGIILIQNHQKQSAKKPLNLKFPTRLQVTQSGFNQPGRGKPSLPFLRHAKKVPAGHSLFSQTKP